MTDLIQIPDTINWPRFYFHMAVTLFFWFIMFLAICIDLWDGLYTAKKIGEPIKSHILRRTFQKAGEYWRIMLFGMLFDLVGMLFAWYIIPFMTLVLTIGVLIIEFRSMMEHSRKRKDGIQNIPDVIAGIIQCTTEKDAVELIKLIKEENKHETN